MKLSKSDEKEFNRLFIAKHGVSPIHTSLKFSKWNISVWNNEDISSIISNPRSVGVELDKLWSEINSTDKNTVVKPVLSELNSSIHKTPIIHEGEINNILTLLGMKNMAQLSTAESTKTNTHCNVGSGNTGETINDTQLETPEGAPKPFDINGDRATVNQQERYAMAFFGTDFGGDVTLREAGIVTGTNPPTDIQIVRVTFADKPITGGQTMTVQITISHKNGTQ